MLVTLSNIHWILVCINFHAIYLFIIIIFKINHWMLFWIKFDVSYIFYFILFKKKDSLDASLDVFGC